MLRTRILPIVFLLLPLALMNTVPRIATQEVCGLSFAVVDNDGSTLSRRIIQRVDASQYLTLTAVCPTYREALAVVEQGQADLIIEIPLHYERNVLLGVGPQLGIAANATNGMKGSMSTSYVTAITQDALYDFMEEQEAAISHRPMVSSLFLYNPHLDYRLYMVPAIFALILTLIVGFLPALNIVGEKEHGTIEQINVTPISNLEFIISKLVPYWVVGIIMAVIGLGAARSIWGFSLVGSIPLFFLFISLYSLLISAAGLVVSNYSSNTQQAALTMYFFLVIFILLSGLLTPIRSMPEWAQWLTLLNPMRYIIEAFTSRVARYLTFVSHSVILLSIPSCCASGPSGVIRKMRRGTTHFLRFAMSFLYYCSSLTSNLFIICGTQMAQI